jgi:hypothetical protein
MIQKAFAITKIHKIICLPLMPRQAVTFANNKYSGNYQFAAYTAAGS